MDYVYKFIKTPVGTLKLVGSDKGLAGVLWPHDTRRCFRPQIMTEDTRHPVLVEAEQQLADYFRGKRRLFSLKLDFVGTPFQKRVWKALGRIPFGKTRTYGELARRIGATRAVRAVGAANGKNPLSIVSPCHRLVGTSGKLTGYSGGLKAKAFLLRLEGVVTKETGRYSELK